MIITQSQIDEILALEPAQQAGDFSRLAKQYAAENGCSYREATLYIKQRFPKARAAFVAAGEAQRLPV
jgi:hypothetical protein